ncbi:MAG: cation:proton antiporter [Methanomassiliicoccales archaeon]|nr:cation:proton antiporter [Methanomassiliicoccales archaeon]NYT14586.1 cation:proton antiporter [Methanomassiliicoccales archaeon]
MAEIGMDFIVDITVIMIVVGIAALVLPRLKYPPAIGYLLGGLILGAGIVPFLTVRDPDSVSFFADLGIILLMFSLGLEFNLKRLRKIGLFAAVAGTIEITIMMAIGYSLGSLLGWGTIESFLLGSVMAISSTALITKMLMDRGTLGSDCGSAVIGMLIIEDFFVIIVLALISPMTSDASLDIFPVIEIALRVVLFIAVGLALGLMVVPKAIDRICMEFREETVLLVSLGLCFSMVLLSIAVELSVAIGAFIMGIIISQAKSAEMVASKVRPINILFVAIFFVSMGMIIDPTTLGESIPTAVLIAVVFIAGSIFAVTFAAYVANRSAENSLLAGLSMVTMGEFSIIIAKVGLDTGIIEGSFYSSVLAATLMTMLVYPLIQWRSPKIIQSIKSRLPLSIKSVIINIEDMRAITRKRISSSSAKSAEVKHEIGMIFIDVIVLVVIVIGANLIYSLRNLPPLSGIDQGLLAIVLLMVTLILLAAPIVSMVSYLRRITDIFTTWTVESEECSEGDPRIIHKVFASIISAIAGMIILFLILPFITMAEGVPWFLLLALVILSAITVYILWSTFHSLHTRVCDAIREGIKEEEEHE